MNDANQGNEKLRINLENGDTYSLHNAVETILVQWCVVAIAIGTAWMTTQWAGQEYHAGLGAGSTGLMLVNGLAATGLALYSWRFRIPMEYTDWWDGISALILGIAIGGLAAATGGFQSAVWFSLLVVAVYTAAVFVYLRGYLALGLLVGVIAIGGWVADDWTRAGSAYGIGLLVSIAIAFMLVKELGRVMYDLIWEVGLKQSALERDFNELKELLGRTAAGDLTFDADDGVERTHEVRPLLQGLDETVTSLRRLVEQIRAGGTEIASAASEMVSSAQQQAASAAQQTGTVAHTTATIEELAATAAQIAETAGSVSRVAQETLVLTGDGRGAVADAVGAMDSIASTVDGIAVSSAGLGDKIGEVGRILVLIDELSEQTNLLALNAAIEAARAGEHGRGFAVVASEVRKLAERAQASTGQIQSIVTEIQAHARSTVLASEQGAREVVRGAELASGAVSALDRIASMVDEATLAAEQISVATQQQRSASDQVVVAMTQVSETSRESATGADSSVQAAARLDGLAASLHKSISRFRTHTG